MTRFDYWKCDACGKILENTECSANQLMYTLIANYDSDDYKAHFCSQRCLKLYVSKQVKDHEDLPKVKGEGYSEMVTLGQMEEEKEKIERDKR
jgi:hypothetical protein